MYHKSETTVQRPSLAGTITSTLFGIAVLPAGLINIFWGNDPFFGIFLIVLAYLYLPPADRLLWSRCRFPVPMIVKILLAIFIVVATLGVGELFDKIDLMMADLK